MPSASRAGFFLLRAICGLAGAISFKATPVAKITRCEPPRHLGVTWEFGGEVSWLAVELSERAGRTHLALEHVAYVDDARWAQYGPGAVGVGWDMTLMGLDQHLGSGQPNDPQAFMAWCGSTEGKEFIRSSSDDWRRASVSAGTEAIAAEKAALRTTAFYSGEPDPTKE